MRNSLYRPFRYTKFGFVFMLFLQLNFLIPSDYVPTQLRLKKLSIKNGLSQSTITNIIQDARGFIWFGTQDGINRYDGYEFKVFRPEKNSASGLTNASVLSVFPDGDSIIWIGTEKGLNRLNTYTEKNNKIYLKGFSKITSVVKISENNLLLASGKQVISWNYTTKETNILKEFSEKINDMLLFRNFILIAAENKLYKLNLGSGKPNTEEVLLNLGQDYRINKIKTDSKSDIWICTSNGLYCFNQNFNIVNHYTKSGNQNNYSLNNNNVVDLLEDKNGVIWIATSGGGINIFDKEKSLFKNFIYENIKYNNNNYLTTLIQDKSGVIWIGSSDNGIEKYEPVKKFKQILYSDFSNNNLPARVFAVMEDTDQNLYVGTYGEGVYVLDKNYNVINKITAGLSSRDITVLYQDKFNKDLIWIGTRFHGLNLYNKKTNSIKVFRHSKFQNSLISDNIFSVRYDNEHYLWVATEEGISRFKPGEDKFINYDISTHKTITNNNIRYILISKNDEIWFATWGGGILKYLREKDSFESFRFSEGYEDNQKDFVSSMTENPGGEIVVCTYGAGFFILDPVKKSFKNLNIKNGLSNNIVYNCLIDSEGNYWMSTNYGISKYYPAEKVFEIYTEEDGLNHNEFNDGAYCILKDKTILFGGFNGLVSFNPREIIRNNYKPGVVITGIKSLNKEIKPDESDNGVPRIDIDLSESFLTINFAALNYLQNEKNRYYYRLEGLSDEWIDLGNKNSLVLSLQDAKLYRLHLKATNNDGVLSDVICTLDINVIPPFYMSLWFKILSIISFITLGYFLYKHRFESVKKQKENLEKLVAERTKELEKTNSDLQQEIQEKNQVQEEIHRYIEELQESKDMMEKNAFDLVEINMKIEESEQKLKELNAQKDKFFSIISHDLKSPFVALLGYSEIMMEDFDSLTDDELREFISSINKSSKNVYSLLENLLEWSRMQTGRIEYIPEYFNLYLTAQNVAELLDDNARKKNIELKNDVDESSIVFADENMVSTIIRNLVSNSLKFTPDGGRVIMKSERESIFTKVTIEDNGIGMNESDRQKLFRIDVHHTTIGTNREKGTGVGLILCKELVEKNGGEIWVESQVGKGSRFIFTLPIKPLAED